MLTSDDLKRLGRLLNNLYLCTGIKFALMDEHAHEVYTTGFQTTFCRLIAQAEGGYERCVACDRIALAEVQESGVRKKYRCHAGLYEVALPVMENGQVIATILFGQMLGDSPREEQWQLVQELCAWHPDPEGLRQAFLRLKRTSSQQMDACTEIVETCVSEVRLSGMAKDDLRDDALQLQAYIDTHFAQPLNVDELCRVLSVGKTKLYQLCEERFGQTPMALLTERRIAAACDLLMETEHTVRFIAQTVGIPDENYFTKVFKRTRGVTPTRYRAAAHGKQNFGKLH